MGNGRTNDDNKSGIVFPQTNNWMANVTHHHCDVKGHRVNDYPDLIDAQRKKFWDDHNAANQAKTATPNPGKDVENVAVAVEKRYCTGI